MKVQKKRQEKKNVLTDKSDKKRMNFNQFMLLVGEYGSAKAAYASERKSGKYDLRREGRLERKANALFEKICDEACVRFPGGSDYRGIDEGVVDCAFKTFVETECDELRREEGAAKFARFLTGGKSTPSVAKCLKEIRMYDKRVYGC